ncbi:hypothetical protein PIB30_068291 [Stylosanthes scabra]|uniref:RRM domain-containing protein n=1 Tax=Stylosanthes scabra TaxID=79078 RepID=A0ABU6URI3_9FABA|nr:hypothetical protein [Stylosanthes scabra]
MERNSVRWAEGFERGKHREGSDFAGGRKKGESVGGSASGVWRDIDNRGRIDKHRWSESNRKSEDCHTIFVDNLPMNISKRDLYREFGRQGFITDVFISRKVRRNANGPFAFVRFKALGGAMRAIEMLNGTSWSGKKLYITMSKFRRERETNRRTQGWVSQGIQGQRTVKKWVPVNTMGIEENNKGLKQSKTKSPIENHVKEVEAKWSEKQRQRLQRSLLGVCVKPIDFRKVMYRLLDDWKGPGEIECRDVGPYRCLITFESPEARDAAMGDELILSLLDEVIPHWEYFWSLSRRIWIEVMGLPIGLWCNENYNKIAKLWGKMVKLDDRIEESKSYSTARILLDCFQWERIHEWVSIKIEDRKFEVFVKEFGSEVYSVQSHPDLGTECSISMEEEKSTSMVEESPV